MSKTSLYQLVILIVIIVIIGFTYYFFFNKKTLISSMNSSQNKINEISIDEGKGSTIDDIYYVSIDKEKNRYEIKSESGEIYSDNSEIIKLKNVNAIINIQNSGIVYISSKNAIYNSKNLKIAGNVKYNNNRNYLKADVVEMDLLTKISKIYMKNKKNKIMGKIVN